MAASATHGAALDMMLRVRHVNHVIGAPESRRIAPPRSIPAHRPTTLALALALSSRSCSCSLAAAPARALADYTDTWWAAGGAEAGWGVNFTQQNRFIFAHVLRLRPRRQGGSGTRRR